MQATATGDANTATTAYLPRDVLSDILLRIPAFHLRALRHVCKEWRDVISSFVSTQRPHAPTHTVVFCDGGSRACWPFIEMCGRGFLFDEHWRFTAGFTVDVSARLIGTCNSLLFFLIHDNAMIKVVEPFSGESIAVPLSPARYANRITRSYSLGFDSRTRQYKIVHGLFNSPSSNIENVEEQDLYVFTVGADKAWRSVRFACDLHGYSRHFPAPACGDGAVYWRGETPDGVLKYARFDLTTEEITSVDRRLVVGQMPVRMITCKYAHASSGLRDIQIRWFGQWEDSCWPHNITALPHEIIEGWLGRRRRLPNQHALQRGHLLLLEEDGSLYAHEINSSSTCMTELYLGREKILIQSTGQIEEPTEWYTFVPVHGRHQQINKSVASSSSQIDDGPIVAKFSYEHRFISTFAYTPTLYLTSARST
ncbi:unnamed protein product [Alopecurus aequalis]